MPAQDRLCQRFEESEWGRRVHIKEKLMIPKSLVHLVVDNLVKMNFYIVPSGSYQTQQKMKDKAKGTGHSRTSRGSHASRNSNDTKSSLSGSIHSRNSMDSALPQASTVMSGQIETSNEPRWSMEEREQPHSDQRGSVSQLRHAENLSSTVHNSRAEETRHRKNSQFSQVPSASQILSPNFGGVEIKPKEDSKGATGDSADHSIPKYGLISSIAGLNSETFVRRHFLTPSFQMIRYKNYLELFETQHEADAISYADVRMQSFGRFITKLSFDNHEDFSLRERDAQLYHHEGILACELFKCRKFLRKLLSEEMKVESSSEAFYIPEELIQANFTNYVRYLLSLPPSLPDFCDHLDPVIISHYNFKSTLQDMRNRLQSIAQDGLENEALCLPGADLIVQAITKVSYEYIRLEQYHIDVLAKLGNNSLVDRRIVKMLFNLYSLNMKLENTESLKILNFNVFFSAQYSWYLSLTIPFVRVFESNMYVSDDEEPEIYSNSRTPWFKQSDKELYDTFFKRLDFDNFDSFSKMTKAELIKLRRDLEGIEVSKDNSFDISRYQRHKPNNFEYLRHSIFKIQSETFHVIQSRDLYLQLKGDNYQVLLREFHRILKKGGILEIPMHIPQYSLGHEKTTVGFPSKPLDDLYQNDRNLVQDFLKTMIRELYVIFGSRNVMLGSALVSPGSKMNTLVASHIALRLHDMYDDIESFLSAFNDRKLSTEEEGNYYFYIRSEKN